jgi:hypothetical protein
MLIGKTCTAALNNRVHLIPSVQLAFLSPTPHLEFPRPDNSLSNGKHAEWEERRRTSAHLHTTYGRSPLARRHTQPGRGRRRSTPHVTWGRSPPSCRTHASCEQQGGHRRNVSWEQRGRLPPPQVLGAAGSSPSREQEAVGSRPPSASVEKQGRQPSSTSIKKRGDAAAASEHGAAGGRGL